MQATLSFAHGKLPQDQVSLRILLYQNELYRIPANYQRLRVVSGTAFVTQAAHDFVLGPGYEATLQRNADFALVSPLRTSPVVVELYS
jgi:hypothetical protein